MRKYYKTQCMDVLSSIEEAHEQVIKYIEKKQIAEAAQLLESCQQGAIQVGTTIDRLEGEGTEAVHILEEYCEEAYQFHEDILTGRLISVRQFRKKLGRSITAEKNELRHNIPTQYEAIFLPYKASMWDSLESIWMAADADLNCQAYVIPIPYFDRNADGTFSKFHYEAEDYPDYVPVVNYAGFNLEEHHPDMIFIHNPYDENNYVTSVHPDYYSKRLKAFTDCLVYVPYYTTCGKMSEGQSLCSAYIYADYIVAQSKAIIDQFDPRIPRKKFLPLGSPKFDRVLQFCQNPPEASTEWKEKMEGKRVYFYNTSLTGMLENTENFLTKLKYVFDTFREVDDACILWRPHPLLRSTFESMRRDDLDKYDALVRYFKEENIGIYDDTPDIEASIALSDAYIGDAGTSVVSLFEVSGKPVFILNNRLSVVPDENDWHGAVFKVLTSDRELNTYCLTQGRQIYKDVTGKYDYRWFCELPDESNMYNSAIAWKKKIICTPIRTENVLIIDADTKDIQRIHLKKKCQSGEQMFNAGYVRNDCLYLMPNKYDSFVKVDLVSKKVDYVDDIGKYYMYEVKGEENENISVPSGITIWKGKFVIIRPDGKEIMFIDQKTLEIERKPIEIGYFCSSISCQKIDADEMWFIPYEGTAITVWNTADDSYTHYDLNIDGLESIDRNKHNACNRLFFAGPVQRTDRKCIFPPMLANKFVLLDRDTKTVSEWKPPIKTETNDVSPYMSNWAMGNFCLNDKDPNKIRFNYFPARKVYDFEPDTGEMTEVPISFDKEEVISKVKTGFMVNESRGSYICFEDVWNSILEIANDRIIGESFEKDRCLEVCTNWNASPEGNCGQKVYEAILREC